MSIKLLNGYNKSGTVCLLKEAADTDERFGGLLFSLSNDSNKI